MKSTPLGRAAADQHLRAAGKRAARHVAVPDAAGEVLRLGRAVVVARRAARRAGSGPSGRRRSRGEPPRGRGARPPRQVGGRLHLRRPRGRPAAGASRAVAASTGPTRRRRRGPRRRRSSVGASVPGPTDALQQAQALHRLGLAGGPRLDPGVSASRSAGRAASTTAPCRRQRRNTAGPAHDRRGRAAPRSPASGSARRSSTRARHDPQPVDAVARARESSAGRKVSAAAIETSGISRPPMPMERMKGSGRNTSSPSPTATVSPENTTARPAVGIVRRRGAVLDAARAYELLAEAVDDQQRVVDRDADPDQRDQVPHVDRHVQRVGQRSRPAPASSDRRSARR